jgi:V8-like Glu-specific endopeptidase
MRLLSGAILICVAVGCGQANEPPVIPEPVQEQSAPIIGGENDDGDPSVVAVYAQQLGSPGGFLCTGSVIAPTLVLTAAHCVSTAETGAGPQFVVLTSANLNRRGGQQLAVREVHANPQWQPDNLQGGHDEGIVILKDPTSLPPLPINRAQAALGALGPSAVGQAVRIVGYGLNDGVTQTGAGIKRQALTKLRSISGALIRLGDSRQGTCNGDSGGPAFMNLGGVETIVGTTSYGNVTCTDGGYDARVDVDLAFIDQYLSPTCVPACDARSCGSDGCGHSCGVCDSSAELCSNEGQCVPVTNGCNSGSGEQEPNDSSLQASPLCAGGESHGTLSSPTDQDWFTWTVTANSIYDVHLVGGPSGALLRVYKLSTSSRLSFIGDGPDVSRHTDAGGTYVARITGGAQSRAAYTLTVTMSP